MFDILLEDYIHVLVSDILTLFLLPSLQTIGAAFVAKPIQVGEKVITLGIWVSERRSELLYGFKAQI